MKKLSLRARVLTGTVAVAALGAGTFGAVSANASPRPPPPPPRSRPTPHNRNLQQSTHLTVAAATKAAQATLDAAKKEKPARLGRRRRPQRQHHRDAARRRRGPAVARVRREEGVHRRLLERPHLRAGQAPGATPNLKDIPGTLFLGGGAPVQVKGAPVAGIGVAGAPSGDLDEKFARRASPPSPDNHHRTAESRDPRTERPMNALDHALLTAHAPATPTVCAPRSRAAPVRRPRRGAAHPAPPRRPRRPRGEAARLSPWPPGPTRTPQDRRARTAPGWSSGVTGSVAMLEVLLPAGPDLTLRNRFGDISLIPAAERGHVAYVREVLRRHRHRRGPRQPASAGPPCWRR